MSWHWGGGAGRKHEQVTGGKHACSHWRLPRAGVQESSLLGAARVGLPCTLVQAVTQNTKYNQILLEEGASSPAQRCHMGKRSPASK